MWGVTLWKEYGWMWTHEKVNRKPVVCSPLRFRAGFSFVCVKICVFSDHFLVERETVKKYDPSIPIYLRSSFFRSLGGFR